MALPQQKHSLFRLPTFAPTVPLVDDVFSSGPDTCLKPFQKEFTEKTGHQKHWGQGSDIQGQGVLA